MSKSDIAVFIGGLLFIIGIVFITTNAQPTTSPSTPSIQYLRDSLEMEYYKKQLESYPVEHSKIPDTVKKK